MKAFLLIFITLPFCINAAETGSTAEEIICEGDRALAEKKWTEAAALYEQFLKDFSCAAEASLLHRIRIAIARCYMSKGDFSSALSVIRNAWESVLASSPSDQMMREKWNLLLWKGIAELETRAAKEAVETFTDLLKLPWMGKEKQRNEIIFLHTNALIHSGKIQEALQWIDKHTASLLPDDTKIRLQLLKVEALIFGKEEGAALKVLLQSISSIRSVSFQLLAIALAQNFIKQGNPYLALQALSVTLQENEILSSTKKMIHSTPPSPQETILQQHPQVDRNLKAFKQFPRWDDTILLLRASAFLDLHRYREAALALEALQQPDIDQFITTLRCWLLLKNPHRCLTIIQKSTSLFSSSPKWDLIQLFKGSALLMLENYDGALHTFHSIQGGEFAESARVQEIKTLLLVHKEEEALQIASNFSYPNSSFLEEVLYLRGIALSNREEYDACRKAMDDLLQRFPNGERTSAAHFLRASAAHRKMDFSIAINELRLTLQKFPGSAEEPEAWLLLGDALLDQGKINDGIAAYQKVPCSSLGLHEIAIFRLSKVLKKIGKLEELKKEMETFRKDHPESPRLPEAIREIGHIIQEQKQPQLVYSLYWETLKQQGSRPAAHSVEILLQDLKKLYTTEGKLDEYQERLQCLRKQAWKEGKYVLAFRIIWAESQLFTDSLQRAEFISGWVTRDPIYHTSSRILSDFSDTLFTAKKFELAEKLYHIILKWHPSAPERDRALAGLARHAQKNGDLKKSLSYWKQLLGQIPESRFVPEALLAEALEDMKIKPAQEKAIAGFNKILHHDLATRKEKVEALYWLGEIHMNQKKPGLAIPYFQRIYIAYGADKKWMAQAYLRSATAFQLLGDFSSAQRTYEEMTHREDLKEFSEFSEAKEKLTQMRKY